MSMLKRKSGLTFIEVAIGVAILLFVLTSGYVAFDTLSKATLSFQMSNKARQKLQSVAEELRLYSTTNFFDLQNMTSNLQALNYDPVKKVYRDRIAVDVKIGVIDPQTRTREVVLTAKWNDGRQTMAIDSSGSANESIKKTVTGYKEKTLTFLVSPLKGVAKGGRVLVHITNINNGEEGINGVKASCVGMDVPLVSCFTGEDGDGICELSNVALRENLEVTLDGGEKGVAYFDESGTRSWIKVRKDLDVTNPRLTYPVNESMYKTATVKGRVYDVTRGPDLDSGAGAVVVALRPVKNLAIPSDSVLFDVTTDGIDDNGTTVIDSEVGYYEISKIIPGTYSLELLGNTNYLAAPNAINDVANPITIEISPGDVLNFATGSSDLNPAKNRISLQTVKRGGMEFSLTQLGGDLSGNYNETDLDANSKVKLNISMHDIDGTPTRTLVFSPNGNLDFNRTFIYNAFYNNYKPMVLKNTSWNFSDYVVQTSTVEMYSYTKIINPVAPLALLAGDISSEKWRKSSSAVSIQPTYFTQDPFIPIIGFNVNGNLRLLYRVIQKQYQGDFYPFMTPVTSPAGAINYLFPIYPGRDNVCELLNGPVDDLASAHSTVANEKFFILDKSALGNITGRIMEWDKDHYIPHDPKDSTHYVYSYTFENDPGTVGRGGVMHSDFVTPDDPGKLFLAHLYSVSTAYIGGKHTFTFKRTRKDDGAGCSNTNNPIDEDCYGIPPNAAGELTQIHYKEFTKANQDPNTTFHILFSVQEKVKNGGVLSIQNVPEDPITISDFSLIAIPNFSTRNAEKRTVGSAKLKNGEVFDLKNMKNFKPSSVKLDHCYKPEDIDKNVAPGLISQINAMGIKPGKSETCDFIIQPAAPIYSPFAIKTDDAENFKNKNYFKYVPPPINVPELQFNHTGGDNYSATVTPGYQVTMYRANKAILTGQVVTGGGSGISNALVSISFSNPNSGQDNPYVTITNDKGEFSFPETYLTPLARDITSPDLTISVNQASYENVVEQFHIYRTVETTDEHYCSPSNGYGCWTLNHHFQMKLKPGASGF